MTLTITPFDAPLGAEVTGVDLRYDLNQEMVKKIYSAWLKHIVLVFRNQSLSTQEQVAFAQNFGTVGDRASPKHKQNEVANGYDGRIMLVTNERDKKGNYIGSLQDGEMWFHHDMSYKPEPHKATLLHALELPSKGGNTKFANMYLAYEQLSNGMKRIVNSLNVIQSSAKRRVMKGRGETVQVGRRAGEEELIAEHPVVRIHSETGRRALYVNQAHSLHFSGMNVQESQPLLNYLFRHQTSSEFTARYRWRPGNPRRPSGRGGGVLAGA